AVGRFVHAIAIRDVAANAGFAGTDINHIVIGIGYRDRAYRRDRILIGEWGPGIAAIYRPPYSPGNPAKVVSVGIATYAGDSQHASAAIGTDQPPFHAFELTFVVLLRRRDNARRYEKNYQAGKHTNSLECHGRKTSW